MKVTRFAPSPTGYLHLGHAFAAFTAREAGTRFLLRIEDIDAARCRPEFEAAIVEDLTWLGIGWDAPILRQSERFDAYRAALETLNARDLVYPCFCTRKDIEEEIARATEAPHGPDGPLYPGTCRTLSNRDRSARIAAGVPYALRLDMTKSSALAGALDFHEDGSGPGDEQGRVAVNPFLFGDVVLARKDAPVSYHLAVVVDDAFQEVSLITRGNDLFSATHVQRVLQALLGLAPPRYAHHRLILDAQGRKFSKRDQAVTLRSLRESGVTVEEIRKRIGFS